MVKYRLILIVSDGATWNQVRYFDTQCLPRPFISVLNYVQDDSISSQSMEECIECQVCFSYRPVSQFPTLTNCSHRPCRICLEIYLKIEIMDSRVIVSCPECSELMHPNDIYGILCMNPQLLLSYERFMVRRVLLSEPDVRWCPGRDCE